MVITVLPPIPTEKYKDSDSNHILKNYSEAPTNANNAKNKKRKINKKDSVEDFVFPKKTARSVSPLPSEPVTVNNSFSDLESENDKDQVALEENNETAPPKPKPLPQFFLKLRKISETNFNPIIKNSQISLTNRQENLLN
ncbi:uncharacterized protein TNCV_322361 [Trichonephila clavipes]|nr:uncharacterized protein TNCV_322361 [Trichonephila clavipes]